jgi:tetratricopeptide (TPR) repeat protein
MTTTTIQQAFDQALKLHQSGRLGEAERLYRQILAVDSHHPGALHLLGVVAGSAGQHAVAADLIGRSTAMQPQNPHAHADHGNALAADDRPEEALLAYERAAALLPNSAILQNNQGNVLGRMGRHNASVAAYKRALALDPDYAEAHSNLGIALEKTGAVDDAIAAYQRAIELKPSLSQTHYNLGLIWQTRGVIDAAVACYQKAIALDPTFPDPYCNLGTALRTKKEFAQAIAAQRKAIELRPGYAKAYLGLGNALQDKGEVDAGIAAYRQAIAIKPDYAQAFCNLGVALRDKGELDEAVVVARRAIELLPHLAEAHSNLGGVLEKKGDFDEADSAYKKAVALDPLSAEAHYNLARVPHHKGDLDASIAAYKKAITLKPAFAEAHSNLGIVLRDKGEFEEAIGAFRRAIEFNPELAEVHANLGMALLLRGEFAEGWVHYEWRSRCEDAETPRHFTQPAWDGAGLDGRTILLHAEQGLGDTMNFVRYLPLVKQRGGRVVLECQPQLHRLLSRCSQGCEIVARGQTLPSFDTHALLVSLPHIFQTNLSNIPRDIPYLQADPADVDVWRRRLSELDPSLKIGLVWAGNPIHKKDRERSIAPAKLAPLGRVPGVRWISLQKEKGATRPDESPAEINLWDATEHLRDLADTAALIANLDLVIGVDTSVMHLAGAMGKPAWMLLPFVPDWRWLLGREDTPWYPSMRLFRQPALQDWQTVVGNVAEALLKWPGH